MEYNPFYTINCFKTMIYVSLGMHGYQEREKSIFNNKVKILNFTEIDEDLLKIHYDKRIKRGDTKLIINKKIRNIIKDLDKTF